MINKLFKFFKKLFAKKQVKPKPIIVNISAKTKGRGGVKK
jgi:hypothetical protein